MSKVSLILKVSAQAKPWSIASKSYIHVQGLAKYDLQAKYSLLPAFVNEVLLEASYDHLFFLYNGSVE